jgi:hypothetical protein
MPQLYRRISRCKQDFGRLQQWFKGGRRKSAQTKPDIGTKLSSKYVVNDTMRLIRGMNWIAQTPRLRKSGVYPLSLNSESL